MKLAAIYNVWDGVELLRGSMNCLKDHVDLFIILYQDVSNFGEQYDPLPEMDLSGFKKIIYKYTPKRNAGQPNEIEKRNIGINIAKQYGCSHIIQMDADEYYADFGSAKQQYINSGRSGSVCKMYAYFKRPTWRMENPDNTYVPFIHKLNPDTTTGYFRAYPFYVDRTRQINQSDIGEIDTIMHHFSWVRNNIERKAGNSSAKSNIERSHFLEDYHSHELDNNPNGFYVRDFRQKIVVVENVFGIIL